MATVDDRLHRAATAAYRRAGSADVSLVDHASFAFMDEQGLTLAFAFDADFERRGCEVLA
jgi:predicted nucleic acid-binding protein